MAYNEQKKKYDMEYQKTKLKRIPINVQIPKYEQIKAAADRAGETMSGYIKGAIDMRMDSEKPKE